MRLYSIGITLVAIGAAVACAPVKHAKAPTALAIVTTVTSQSTSTETSTSTGSSVNTGSNTNNATGVTSSVTTTPINPPNNVPPSNVGSGTTSSTTTGLTTSNPTSDVGTSNTTSSTTTSTTTKPPVVVEPALIDLKDFKIVFDEKYKKDAKAANELAAMLLSTGGQTYYVRFVPDKADLNKGEAKILSKKQIETTGAGPTCAVKIADPAKITKDFKLPRTLLMRQDQPKVPTHFSSSLNVSAVENKGIPATLMTCWWTAVDPQTKEAKGVDFKLYITPSMFNDFTRGVFTITK